MGKPTFISTFAGCGGSSLGFRKAGFEELAAVEWNDNAVECLLLNWPTLRIFHGDIKGITSRRIMKECRIKRGELDVLDGSPPCQGFSTAGRRDMKDPRSTMFKEFVRLLREIQPKAFVMENVKGMVSGVMRHVFVIIMRELRNSGYKVAARVLNAAHYGVPQNRSRVIFIGIRTDLGLDPVHPLPSSKPVAVGEAIEDFGDVPCEALDHIWLDESPRGRHTKTWALARQALQGQKYAGHSRRDFWDQPANTITTTGLPDSYPYLRSMNCHPLYTRTYSVAEYKRLFTFPDDFKFAGVWHNAVLRMGNSVPPLLMAAVAKQILNTLSRGKS